MGKKSNQRFQRGRRSTAARAPAATPNADESYKAPTLGMRDVTFTEGTAQDAARFEDVINKLASYVGTRPWSQSSEVAKAMGDLRAPVYDEPTKPLRKYYVHLEASETMPATRAQTTSKFHTDQRTENILVDDEFDWKLELAEYATDKAEWKKQTRNWVENSARVYHLVLLHCPPGLIAELQNHSKWIAGKAAQDCIALLLMIRDLTHGMKETKQGTMALVQVHVDLITPTQRPNKSVEAYYKLFCARRNTVNAHSVEAGFHKELYMKASIKVMTAKSHDDTFMTNAASDANALAEKAAIKK